MKNLPKGTVFSTTEQRNSLAGRGHGSARSIDCLSPDRPCLDLGSQPEHSVAFLEQLRGKWKSTLSRGLQFSVAWKFPSGSDGHAWPIGCLALAAHGNRGDPREPPRGGLTRNVLKDSANLWLGDPALNPVFAVAAVAGAPTPRSPCPKAIPTPLHPHLCIQTFGSHLHF